VSSPWETSFVAVSAALGEPYETAIASLGEAGASRATEIVAALADTSRAARAKGLAVALARVAQDLDAMGLA
jgi:hypothetical protein